MGYLLGSLIWGAKSGQYCVIGVGRYTLSLSLSLSLTISLSLSVESEEGRGIGLEKEGKKKKIIEACVREEKRRKMKGRYEF
jgi:hypothetical protein